MLDSDSKYIDEYKRVDKLCADTLGDDGGITAYIELMKKAAKSSDDLPGSWSTALKTLVHLRHIRNSIAHDTTPLSCTQNDLNSLKAFGRALSDGRDPISCFNSYKKQTQRTHSSSPSGKSKAGGNSKNKPEVYENRRSAGRTASLIFAAIILIIMVAAVFILKVFPQ